MTADAAGGSAQAKEAFVVGTSGWSFLDWVGEFYPPGTRKSEMFGSYVQAFRSVEVNYTYYRMPSGRTMDALARKSPPGFDFWVKAHQSMTHQNEIAGVGEFLQALDPLAGMDKLAGVLLQFPQRFHRTRDNRTYLARLIDAMEPIRTAVEFRHASWQHPSVDEGLAQRSAALVIPDVPDIGALFHHPPGVTGPVGYLRLHSRNAANWYAGAVERYDYDYDAAQLREILASWTPCLDDQGRKIYAFFNNCHRAQAARNAEAFRRILGQIPAQPTRA
jgi:uncharacterized protein YecE (DUF72 family)